MRTTSNNTNNNASAISFETLETREMMSAVHHSTAFARRHAAQPVKPVAPVVAPVVVPLTVSQNGTELLITGTTGNDNIKVSQNGTTYTITNGDWSTTMTGAFKDVRVNGNGGNDAITLAASVTTDALLYGAAGNDTIVGGAGNDQIFAGAGSNTVNGGAGNDTIVTLGSSADAITGGAGNDTFWTDDSKTEIVTDLSKSENATAYHRVGAFLGLQNADGTTTAVSKDLLGQNLADPTAASDANGTKNFSTVPLFGANGPQIDDITQGYVGDCYFLSTLASMAKVNPDRIRQSVVSLGDGTYAVQFTKANGQRAFLRVDGDLPTWYGSNAYAGTGKGMWVAVMEKAWAEYRWTTGNQTAGYSYGTYAAIEGGWMDEVYTALGTSSTDIWGASTGADLLSQIAKALAAGKSVTYATASSPAGSNLVADHAYTVDHVGVDAKGNATLTLRNPWGIDGYACTDGANDGYVTLTGAQALAALSGVSIGLA